MDLKGKTVLVTGASTGIGKAIALEFAKNGSNVVVNYRKNKQAAEELMQEIQKFEGNHLMIQADASNTEEVKRMFDQISSHYQTLDILVNNAGDAQSIDFENSPLEDWHYQMNNNFFSAIINSKEFLKLKGSNQIRKIINISSIWGFDDKCPPDYMAYGASKAALNSLTKNMAKKFAPNILINAIAPGYVLTPHWGEMTQSEVKTWGNQQLIQRFIEPTEIAEGAILLAQNDAITGTILSIDGGIGLKTV